MNDYVRAKCYFFVTQLYKYACEIYFSMLFILKHKTILSIKQNETIPKWIVGVVEIKVPTYSYTRISAEYNWY